MKIFAWILTSAGIATLGASLAFAAPKAYDLPRETAKLKAGPGMEIAQNNCTACHSVDYIAIQPPNKGEGFWTAEVQKMIKVYHAPIEEADIKTIADYLAKTY